MNVPGDISPERRLDGGKVEVIMVFFSRVVEGGVEGVLSLFQGEDTNGFRKELIEADQKTW